MADLTTTEAATRLGVGKSTVTLWCRQGRFPNAYSEETPFGSYWKIPESDLKSLQRPERGRPSTKKAAKKGSKK